MRFAKHRAIIHFAADTRELMRRCRTTASTSAFQAEDVGSTPITCSTKQARGKSSGLLAATTAYADVAELADALDSGSSGSDTVGVQVPSSAPSETPCKPMVYRVFLCLPGWGFASQEEIQRLHSLTLHDSIVPCWLPADKKRRSLATGCTAFYRVTG